MAGIPAAGRYADPFGFSQNPYADPHALAGFLTRYTATSVATERAATGGDMYYSSGFLGAGGNQTSLGGTILSGVLGGLESIFHFPTANVPSARTPATLPTDTTTANQHPILTGAGSASGNAGRTATAVGVGTAVAGGVAGLVAPHLVGLGGGRAARYAPAGTRGYHMIKKGPHAGLWTRNRHRNVANIRALRRALSRAHGFERVCRKVMHFVSPHKSRGRPVFRRRRRKC